MNRVIKIFIILIIALITFGRINKVYAANVINQQKSNWGDIFTTGDDFIKKGSDSQNSIIDEEQLRTDASSIFKILTTIGITLSVIIGGILGIKFMMASAEDKAQIKEMLIPYVVGCVVIYGAVTIWMIVVKIMEQI
ncbi:MAG: hypothetical protein ILA02_00910 [Clostridia bacterium]|nr:hypothetical protein [Clostridia bacterium]